MSSPGIGGTTVGSQLRPEVYQQESTAANENTKQAALIVKDSLQLSFTDMKEQHFKYKNDPKRPMIPMYVQVTVTSQEKQDKPWTKAFGELAKSLPGKLKNQLANQLKLPANKRDPRFGALIKGLQFAAKGLHWLREAKNQKYAITDSEKRQLEQDFIENSTGFYKEMLAAFLRVVTEMPPNVKERPTLMQVVKKLPQILQSIGKKRERKLKTKELKITDEKVLLEIDEVRSHMHKNIGDHPLLIPNYLIDYLEVIHQLSYPGLNIHLYRILLRQYHSLCKTQSEYGLIGLQVGKISHGIASLAPRSVFDKERESLINLLSATAISLFAQGASKQDFGFRLIIGIVIASRFITRMGVEWLQGLLYTKEEAELIADSILGSAMGALFILTDVNELKRQEKEELFLLLKKPLQKLCQRLQRRLEGKRDVSELKLFLRKMSQHIDSDAYQLVYQEWHRMAADYGLDGEKLEKDLKAINAFINVVQHEMGEFQKEEQKVNLLQRPA